GHGGGVDAVAGHAAAAAPRAVRRAAAAGPPAVLRAAAGAPPTLLGRQLREELGRPARRRAAAGVEGVQFLVLGDVDEREEIAADARVVLRGDVEHGAGRDGGIDGVAALLEDVDAGLSRQRIARRDDAVARQ